MGRGIKQWLREVKMLNVDEMHPVMIFLDVFVIAMLVFAEELSIWLPVRVWMGLCLIFILYTKPLSTYHIGRRHKIEEDMSRRGWFN